MAANIISPMKSFFQSCMDHNPFAQVKNGPVENVFIKAMVALPIIGRIGSTVMRNATNFDANSPINADRKVEVLRADRRLTTLEIASRVLTMAGLIAMIATGVFAPVASIALIFFAFSLGEKCVAHLKLSDKINEELKNKVVVEQQL